LNGGNTTVIRTYDDGMHVTLVAPATASGLQFSSWSGVDSQNGTSATVTMSSDRTVTAAYAAAGGGPWSGASDAGNGWKYLSWFGYFSDTYPPWIYHLQHGWLYPVGETSDSIWLYSLGDQDWFWTSRTVQPWFFEYSSGCWLYYLRNSSNPRWFFSWCSQQWEVR
jgi:hypothetical protein